MREIDIFMFLEKIQLKVISRMDSSTGGAYLVSNGREKYFAKIKTSLDAIFQEQILVDKLISNGIDTPRILKIELISDTKGLYLVLYEYISKIQEQIVDIEYISKGICNLHKILGKIQINTYIYIDIFEYFSKKCIPYVYKCSREIQKIIEPIVKSLNEDMLKENIKKLKLQLVHGDLHNLNMYKTKGGSVGFLDFENTIYTYRIYDIGYYLLSIWKKEVFLEEWLYKLYSFLDSYKIINEEKKIIYEVMVCILIMKLATGLSNFHKPMIDSSLLQLKFVYRYREQITCL